MGEFMEYTFERLDIDKLFANHNISGENKANEIMEWEVVSVTSTFGTLNAVPEKLPSFKNMGCFNHYKNKN